MDDKLDFKIIKQLIEYSNIISNMYNELYSLDINNEKNSKCYSNIIDLLIEIKGKELKIYNSIGENELQAYLNYFINLHDESSDLKENKSKILFSEVESYIITRIINMLKDTIELEFNMEATYSEYIDNEFKELIEQFNQELNKQNDFINFRNSALDLSIVFLNESIKNINNEVLKNELIKIIYIYSFFNIRVEDKFLFNKFDLNKENIFFIPNYKDYTYISECAYQCSIAQIKCLLKNDNYTENKDYILDLSILKSYLHFLSDDDIVKIINKLYSSKNKNSNVKVKLIGEMKKILNENQK